jgi:UDP:flavonoid glycosyltransferase YjiC (YdhE family)
MLSSVLFIALGSWGDVAPVLAVAQALGRLGVEPRVAVATDYADRVRAAGLTAVDLGVGIETLMSGTVGRAWVKASAGGQQATVRAVREVFDVVGPRTTEVVAEAVRPGEAIVSGMMTFALGAAVAETRRSAHAQLLFMPLTPSRQPTSTAFPITPWASGLNRWSAGMAQQAVERNNRVWTNTLRAGLGLRAWTPTDYLEAFARTPVLYGTSPHFIAAASDWPDHVSVSGHLLADDVTPGPAGLSAFLTAHPDAVYVGFGSIANAVESPDWYIAV